MSAAVERVLGALKNVRLTASGYEAFCPVHGDTKTRHLSIKEGDDGRALLYCHRCGANGEEVADAIELNPRDLFERRNGDKQRGKIAATYDYRGPDGELLFQAVRFDPKGFAQRQPDGDGGWSWNLQGIEPVLYRLSDILEAVRFGKTIYLVEGEKDADRLASFGLTATCNPMGAQKWRDSYSETLRGASVVIVPDADVPGREHAEAVARSLQSKAVSVRVLELPGLPWGDDLPEKHGPDVSDWLDAGHATAELEKLAREAPAGVHLAEELRQSAGIAETDDKVPDPVGVLLSEVKAQPVEWMWRGRIPKGKLTLIDGDPGEGKSAMATDLAACKSADRPWPDGAECEAGGVVICSAEDGLSDTIRPRLEAAGADLSRVLALATVKDRDEERLLSIPEDLPAIRQGIERVGAELVIVDPLIAFLSADVNSHRDQDVRRALAPLAKLAEESGAAVVVVRHLNKSSGGNPLYRGGGSIGIIGAARSALLVARHPEDEHRRVLAPLKSNLAEMAPSLAFALTEAANGAVRVEWKGETNHTANALLAVPTDPEERSALDEAMEFLRDALGSGRMWSVQVKKDAHAADFSEATLRRAKTALGIRSVKEADGSWSWALPGQEEEEQGAQGEHEPSRAPQDEHLEHLPIDKPNTEGQQEQGAQDAQASGNGPKRRLSAEQEERVAQLIHQGMSRTWARAEVLGRSDGPPVDGLNPGEART